MLPEKESRTRSSGYGPGYTPPRGTAKVVVHRGEQSPGDQGFDWQYALVLEKQTEKPSADPLKQEETERKKQQEVCSRLLEDDERSRFKFEAHVGVAPGQHAGFWVIQGPQQQP